MTRNGYETELLAAKVAVEEAKENRFVTELEDKSSQVATTYKYFFFMETLSVFSKGNITMYMLDCKRVSIVPKLVFLWEFFLGKNLALMELLGCLR